MKSNQQVRQGRVKVFAAVMGGSAVVAMGALSVALHEEQASGAFRWGRYGCNLHAREHDHGTNRHHDDAPCSSRDVRRGATGQGAALRRRRVRSRPADDAVTTRRVVRGRGQHVLVGALCYPVN